MNCKPGDLAVKVSGFDQGLLVDVIDLHPMHSNVWRTKPHRPFWRREDTKNLFWPVYDSELRPIRDPGDDAQDETLSWLPVPRHDDDYSPTWTPAEIEAAVRAANRTKGT